MQHRTRRGEKLSMNREQTNATAARRRRHQTAATRAFADQRFSIVDILAHSHRKGHSGQEWVEYLVSIVAACVAVAGILVIFAARTPEPPHSTTKSKHAYALSQSSPEVHTQVDLQDVHLHPRQIAYDHVRNGLWFWTSIQNAGTAFDNRIYFYDIDQNRLQVWPLYSGDWSAQLLAGLDVAPNGEVWVGWNHNLVQFDPTSGSYVRYQLPSQSQYPLPASVMGDLPTDLGVTDLRVAQDGVIWLGRYGVQALTTFTPSNRTFHEVALPPSAGDVAKVAIGPDGHVFFTTNFSADHPGHILEKTGELNPKTGAIRIYHHGAQSLAVTPQGDLYTVLGGHSFGLARTTSAERISSLAQGRETSFTGGLVPFDVEDSSVASDLHGRIWVAVAGQPDLAALDTATGQVREYQYATAVADASHVNGSPRNTGAGGQNSQATPGTSTMYLIAPIAAMATDALGHLWYVRIGSDHIEEVSA